MNARLQDDRRFPLFLTGAVTIGLSYWAGVSGIEILASNVLFFIGMVCLGAALKGSPLGKQIAVLSVGLLAGVVLLVELYGLGWASPVWLAFMAGVFFTAAGRFGRF